MGRLALPVALLLVLPLVASAAWTGGGDPAPPATGGPAPGAADPTATDPKATAAAAPSSQAAEGGTRHHEGLTLVLTFGLTDRLQVHSSTSVAWNPRSGRQGDSFPVDDVLEVRFRLGPRGVPWVPHLGIRIGPPRPPSHPTMASPEAVG